MVKREIVVYTDGGAGTCGYYVVEHGRPVYCRGLTIKGTSNDCEYAGVLAGLGWLLKHHARGATIRSDSKLVVEQVLGRWRCNVPRLEQKRDKVRRMLAEMDAKIVWIGRDDNLAHDPAQEPRREEARREMVSEIAASQGTLFG